MLEETYYFTSLWAYIKRKIWMSHTLSTVCADDLWVILWIKYYDWTNHYLPHTEVKQSSMGFSLLFLFLFYHSQSIIFSTTPFYTLTSNLGSNKSLIKKNVSAWTSLPLPRIPPLQVVTEHWVWAPWVMQQIPTGFCFTDGIAYVSMVLSPLIPPSPSHRHGEQTYGHGPGRGAVWEGESGKDF